VTRRTAGLADPAIVVSRPPRWATFTVVLPDTRAPYPLRAVHSRRPTLVTTTHATDRVPVYRPYLGPEITTAVQAALEAGWLGMGRLSQQFEQGLEHYLELDERRVVTTNSCTEALHIAARLIDLGPGDEVICPSFTYVAGHQAITRTGAELVFCDIDGDRLGIDPARVQELISGRTKAILAVDYLGLPCRLDELMEIARKHGLRVIEDAAHAFGSRSLDRPVVPSVISLASVSAR
jgi:dTDP-4-amino-4,6-dideoxygalactose transaminase